MAYRFNKADLEQIDTLVNNVNTLPWCFRFVD